MLDRDLAALYEIETKALNLAVKRNIKRFPKDFMFQLTKEEFEDLRLSETLTSKEVIRKRNWQFAISNLQCNQLPASRNE